MSNIARVAVPALADTCFVDILEERDQLKREEVAFSEDRERISVEQASLLWPLPDPAGLPMQALKSGKALIVNADESGPPSGERGVELVGAQANALCVPLTSRSRTFGVLTLLSSDPERRYTNTDLEVAERARAASRCGTVQRQALPGLAQRDSSTRRRARDGVARSARTAPDHQARCRRDLRSSRPPEAAGNASSKPSCAASMHGAPMVSDLLDLTSIEAGHLSVDRQGHEIYGLIRDAFEMLSPLARAKSIDLRVEVLTPPRSVLCDRERVLQVFSNLVGNAIKFTKEGGSVAIRAELQRNQACFAVRDNGPGIPEPIRLHLFERYWQAEERVEEDRTRPRALHRERYRGSAGRPYLVRQRARHGQHLLLHAAALAGGRLRQRRGEPRAQLAKVCARAPRTRPPSTRRRALLRSRPTNETSSRRLSPVCAGIVDGSSRKSR